MPIKQFFYFDAIECLPENIFQSVTMTNHSNERMSRYYSQEIVFGKDFQHQLGHLKYFLVNI